MNQKTFNKILYNFKKSDLDHLLAWRVYLKCLNLLREQDNIEYIEQLGTMSSKEKLQWRNKLAEKGIELTPNQVEDYILILCLAIHTSWKLNQNGD